MWRRGFLIFGFLALVLFFSPLKVKAVETAPENQVFINELMWMGGVSTADEWIELYNPGKEAVPLSGWEISDLASSGEEELMLTIPEGATIAPDGYFLIANYIKGAKSTLAVSPDYVTTAVGLSNTNLKIKLHSGDWQDPNLFVDVAGDGKTPLAGENSTIKSSMERNADLADGKLAASWHTAYSSVNLTDLTQNGSPGALNTIEVLPDLILPEIVNPLDDTDINKTELDFKWENANEQPVKFELVVSRNDDLSEPVIEEEDIDDLSFLVEDLDWGKYFWQLTVSNELDEKSTDIFSFNLVEPVYSKAVVVNELMPAPMTDEAQNEWIELYNSSDQAVDLTGWALEDVGGSTKKYIITDAIIEPLDFLVFSRPRTGITLNNDSDGVRLYQPNDKVIFETPVFTSSTKGYAWARTKNGDFQWTATPTSSKANEFYLPPEEQKADPEEVKKPKINKKPIKIETGKFSYFENKLVQVQGTVSSTSGQTFYLNDDSGPAKVYIQTKTKIDKPPMHKGDIFQIIGVVDLYRGDYRILPRTQDDIFLIELFVKSDSLAKTIPIISKTTSYKNSPANSSANQARAPNILTEPLIQEAKAATNSTAAQSISTSSSFWFQILKAVIGLALILLVLLIFKLRSRPRIKIIGGHFGRDET